MKRFKGATNRSYKYCSSTISALIAAVFGSLCAFIFLLADLIPTLPVELMGAESYYAGISITNRLLSVYIGLVVSIITFFILSTNNSISGVAHKKLSIYYLCLRNIAESLFQKLFLHKRVAELKEKRIEWLLSGIFLSFVTSYLFVSFIMPIFATLSTDVFTFWKRMLRAGMYVIAVSLALSFGVLWLKAKKETLKQVLWAWQLIFPLTFLLILPVPVFNGSKLIQVFECTWLYVIIGVLVFCTYCDIFRRKKFSFSIEMISPLVGLTIVILLIGRVSPKISDLYELSARIPGLWMSWNSDLSLFSDLYITFGISDNLRVLFGQALFGKMTLITASAGTHYFNFLSKVVLFFTLLRFVPLVVAIIISLIVPQPFFLIYILILVLPPLYKRPFYWLIIWASTSALFTFFYIPQGIASVFASIPFAILQFYALFQTSKRKTLIILFLGLTLAFALFIYPFGKYTRGLLRIVLETAAVNSHWAANGANTKVIYHIINYCSFFITISASLLCTKLLLQTFKKNKNIKRVVLGVCSFIILYLFVNVSYGYSRLDSSLYRAVNTALLLLSTLLLLLYVLPTDKKLKFTKFFILLISLFLCNNPLSVFNIKMSKNEDYIYTRENSAIPRIGEGMIPLRLEEKTLKLKKLFDRVLAPQESFLSLAEQPHQYFTLNRPMWTEYPSPYVYPGDIPQKHALKVLRAQNIRLSLIDTALTLDHSPFYIRTWYLYRYAMSQGLPFEVSKDSCVIMPVEYFSRVNKPIPTLTESIAILDKYISNINLGKIPVVWGRGMKRWLKELSLVLTCNDSVDKLDKSYWTWIFKKPLSGSQVTYLMVELSGVEKDYIDIDLYWDNDGISDYKNNKISFQAKNGICLVPLDISPRWLLSPKLVSLSIKTANNLKIKVKRASLLYRDPKTQE